MPHNMWPQIPSELSLLMVIVTGAPNKNGMGPDKLKTKGYVFHM